MYLDLDYILTTIGQTEMVCESSLSVWFAEHTAFSSKSKSLGLILKNTSWNEINWYLSIIQSVKKLFFWRCKMLQVHCMSITVYYQAFCSYHHVSRMKIIWGRKRWQSKLKHWFIVLRKSIVLPFSKGSMTFSIYCFSTLATSKIGCGLPILFLNRATFRFLLFGGAGI